MTRPLPEIARSLHVGQLATMEHAVACEREDCLDWRDDLLTAEHKLAEARALIAHVVSQQEAAERRVAKLQAEWLPTLSQLEMFQGAVQ